MSETRLRRRAVLHALILGLGAAGLGRVMFACKEEDAGNPHPADVLPKGNPDKSDADEYVPGESPPIIANTEAPKVPNQAWEARAKQLDSEQARMFRKDAFTKANPDPPNRSASHVPNARVEAADGGLTRVIVVVNHQMGQNKLDAGAMDASADTGPKDAGVDAAHAGDADAGDAGDAGATLPPIEHYITTIFLRAKVGDVDTVVGLWEFSSTDAAPPTVSFVLPAGVKAVTAYEWCTLHGLWASEPLAIP